jgi:hypothetical protein
MRPSPDGGRVRRDVLEHGSTWIVFAELSDTYESTAVGSGDTSFHYYGPWTVTSTQDCDGDAPRKFGSFPETRADAIIEHHPSAGVPWLLPMVVAREGTVTWSPDPKDICGLPVETYSLDAISKAAVPGVNLDQRFDYFANVNPYARCGVAQRSGVGTGAARKPSLVWA